MQELFNKLKIKPKDLTLYDKAFSHSSYAHEHKQKQDYERLEFLGDAIVDLVVADYLFHQKNENEGKMTKIRASYVCEDALYQYSLHLGLNNYIKVGHGEENNGGKYKKAIIADIFESLMAAIYLDLGYATVRRVIINIIGPLIEDEKINFFKDYKSLLQEYVQTTRQSLEYLLLKEKGPDHDKKFTIEVKIDNIVYGVGTAGSKKHAEQIAAQNALEKLAKKD